MDSRDRDEREKNGSSGRVEKIRESRRNESRDEDTIKNKKSEEAGYINLTEKYDPSDDGEFDPEPDDVNDDIWDPEEEEDDDDFEDEGEDVSSFNII